MSAYTHTPGSPLPEFVHQAAEGCKTAAAAVMTLAAPGLKKSVLVAWEQHITRALDSGATVQSLIDDKNVARLTVTGFATSLVLDYPVRLVVTKNRVGSRESDWTLWRPKV